MRISGLASGMDIDQIVSDLMKARRIPVDKMMQKRQTIQWQMDEYRSVNLKMNEFRNKIVDNFILTRQKLLAKNVTSSDSTRVSATASSSAGNVTYNLSEVKQLATAATTFSANQLTKTGEEKIDPSKSLLSQKDRFQNNNFGWKTGIIEKETISVEADNQKIFKLDETKVPSLKQDYTDDMVVKVNGKVYNVVDNTAGGLGRELNENEVSINYDTGELEFAKPLVKGSQINVTYFRDQEVQSFTNTPAKTFQLDKGSIDLDSLTIDVNGTQYTAAGPNQIVTDPELLDDNNVLVNVDTGEITFKNEQTENVSVTYQQAFMTSGVTTYNQSGEVQDKFVFEGKQSLSSIVNELNRSSTGISVMYDDFSDRVSVTRKQTGIFNETGDEIQFSGNLFSQALGLNSYQMELDANNTMLDLKDAAGQSVPYSIIQSDGSTYAGSVSVVGGKLLDDGGNELAGARIVADGKDIATSDSDGNFTFKGVQGGQNAKFTLNGLETERHTNTFTVDGVTMTLKSTFSPPDDQPVSLTVGTDTEKVIESIKGFVDDYNALLDLVNGKLKEERYRDYQPLTDEQKEALSEKEVERWEEKAKSGLLRNDSILRGAMDRLRLDIYNPVSSSLETEYKQLSAIGITTSKDFMERGKLEIDENKLRDAIEKDAEGVYTIFAADGEGTNNQGIIRRMRDTLDSSMKSLAERAGGSRGLVQNHQFTLGRNLNDINDQITNFERRLQQVEDRYWRQFTAMEKAMAQANQQAETMFSQLFGQNQQ